MSEVSKALSHYRSAIDLWWSGVKRRNQERREGERMQIQARLAARQEQQRKIAAGDVEWAPGWYQHPTEPPGYQRWWDGSRWTEHTQQSRAALKTSGRKESGGLAAAGLVTFILGLLFWPIFLATFVIGIILATKPGRGGDGALLIVLSVIGPIISIAGCAAIITSGS